MPGCFNKSHLVDFIIDRVPGSLSRAACCHYYPTYWKWLMGILSIPWPEKVEFPQVWMESGDPICQSPLSLLFLLYSFAGTAGQRKWNSNTSGIDYSCLMAYSRKVKGSSLRSTIGIWSLSFTYTKTPCQDKVSGSIFSGQCWPCICQQYVPPPPSPCYTG